jgi:uncharacterized lipoprotein YddW (UPF0748 family)
MRNDQKPQRYFRLSLLRKLLLLATALTLLQNLPIGARTAGPPQPSHRSRRNQPGPKKGDLPQVQREFRAVWIATVDNIDFPSRKDLSPEEQKRELLGILDLAKSLRLNAVIFQVRPMADAVYKPGYEPWSEFLTGQMGRGQGFDPLEFLVTAAHKRGILVHAWFNPYRAYLPAAKTISDDHISKLHPEFVRQYGRYMWIDPTDPVGKAWTLKVIADVVRRYDVDGVHFDDYFYPYKEKDTSGKEIDFPDDKNWQIYKTSGGRLGRDDWRRENVNDLIESVGHEIKQIKPDVVYGISPFGIWRPDAAEGISGFDSYAQLYADSRKWLADGTVDYLSPQLYWETAKKEQSFPVLLGWWRLQNVKDRFIWPGIAAYRIGSTPTFNAGEIADQITETRRYPLTDGAVYFSEKSLRNDLGGIQAKLRDNVYERDALTPAFTWIKSATILPPNLSITRDDKYVRATWTEQGTRKAFWFVVYAKDKKGWSYSILPSAERSIALSADRRLEKMVVTSVDRLGNESQNRPQ